LRQTSSRALPVTSITAMKKAKGYSTFWTAC
jgi:hypothetical protein